MRGEKKDEEVKTHRCASGHAQNTSPANLRMQVENLDIRWVWTMALSLTNWDFNKFNNLCFLGPLFK